ncbi:S49 family peptidase [Limnoglobus roseus]|uniref:S49 family peptidase n=1 Tax=Limnoglobus roseus TaxID=2598579 RepID=A0A5C1A6I0_9BACT|nr:S49 family peptidase [Limnoglobus roseus]QEL14340.1 S49 family peptidase [Limnoglobus roseus]
MRDFDLLHLAGKLYAQPWAIVPEKFRELVAVFEARRAGGESVTKSDAEAVARVQQEIRRERATIIRAKLRNVAGMTVDQVGKVAILPMFGTITQRPSLFSQYSGGTSAEQFVHAHSQLLADDGVKSIIWDIDSPGGSVAGVPEAAGQLLAMRGQKRTVAFSNTVMASAAYWLGSAADEIVSAPSAITGSIGVVAVHQDRSQANDKVGVSVNYVHAGKYKVEGNPDQPLGGEARAAIQQTIDDYYGQFVRDVAKARKTTTAAVRSGYGEGRVLTAERARSAKLVDRVESLSALIGRIVSYSTNSGGMAAAIRRQRQVEAELV